ncbi:MAG TPA: S1 RNA-binding domain-containing protein [Candidatus Paceibacterota bacterium]
MPTDTAAAPRKKKAPAEPSVPLTGMAKAVAESPARPKVGELVEGKVIAIDKASLFVDLPPFGTGLIFGREFIVARDIIRKVHIGDSVAAKVVLAENEDGYVELSLKEAKQALIWGEVEEIVKEKRPLDLAVMEANKGGLILNWQGIQGFLPASQLASEHYPRVSDGSKERILEELKKLVGTRLVVTIIGATEDDGRLIFSEKAVGSRDKGAALEALTVGETVEGEVTGAVDFGVFVRVAEGLEGLVHISEMDWALVDDPRKRFKPGDRVKVKVIDVKDGKVSLSIKALKPNPWVEAGGKYKKGDIVKGVVIKYNKHGALASIEEGVAGLVHISEFDGEPDLRAKLELGRPYDFRITLFDAKEQRMTLSTKLEEVKKKEEAVVAKAE